MGLLGSLFNPATGQPSTGGVPAAPIAAAPAPITPTPTPAPSSAPAPGSPLDQFTNFWQTPVDKDGKPIVHNNPLAAPILNFDPKVIAESANKLDFMAGVSPENIAKALGGDQAAFADVINQAVRSAVVGITTNQGQMLNGVVDANNARLLSTLPSHIKRVQLDQQPVDNPILEHPAVEPMVRALKAAEFNKNPNADPAEVHARVVGFVKTFAGALMEGSNPDGTPKAEAPKEMDWAAWASS